MGVLPVGSARRHVHRAALKDVEDVAVLALAHDGPSGRRAHSAHPRRQGNEADRRQADSRGAWPKQGD